MKTVERTVLGIEAGAVAAGGAGLAFLMFDLVRLEPLASIGVLSGALPGPGGLELDLTSLTGLLAALDTGLRVAAFTAGYFLAFALAGVLASFLFDWRRWGGLGRLLGLAALCLVAFYSTVGLSSSVVAVESLGLPLVVGVNLLAAVLMGGGLYVGSLPTSSEESGG